MKKEDTDLKYWVHFIYYILNNLLLYNTLKTNINQVWKLFASASMALKLELYININKIVC